MKLIFLDADGTLFHHEGYIPDSAIKACIQAQKNGKHKKTDTKSFYAQEDSALKSLARC